MRTEKSIALIHPQPRRWSVVRIFTGADFEGIVVPCGWQVTDRHGEAMKEPAHPVLAQGKVRHVGDPIAAVIAESLEQARDAGEALNIDIEERGVVDMKAALSEGPQPFMTI